MAHIGKDIAARALEHDDGGDGDGRRRRKKKMTPTKEVHTEDDADDAKTTDGPTAGALPPLRESASRQERRRTARIRMLRVGRVGVTKSGFTEAPRLARLRVSFGHLQSLSLQPPSELPQSQSLPFSTTFPSPERIHEKRAKDREAAYFRRVQIARKNDRFPKLQFD